MVRIRKTELNMALRLEEDLTEGQLVMDKREFVPWDIQKKSWFIESMLLGFPIAPIYISEFFDGKTTFTLIDGRKRMDAYLSYTAGDFPLGECRFAKSVSGKYFSELPAYYQRIIVTYMFQVATVQIDSPEDTNLIIERLNN